MKKLTILLTSAVIVSLSSCDFGKKDARNMEISDSLQHIINLRDAEINDLLTVFNDIQESFNEINEAEDRIALIRSGETNGSKETIKENFNFIKEKMRQNKQMIEDLQQQLRESSFKGEELKRTLNSLISQLEEKDNRLIQLAKVLEEKEITIASQSVQISQQSETISQQENTISEQNQSITTLNNQVDEQKEENSRNRATISDQDQQIFAAYYTFGTKSELKEQNILSGGEVLKGNYNKNYFTKIDTRTTKEIKLYSKSAKLLTTHPTNSYTLQKDINNQYVLKISDPTRFWATSKYLVVQVK